MDIIFFLLIIVNLLSGYHLYNLDSNSPIIKSIQSPNKSSFGFSLSVFSSKKHSNQKVILVGAPTDQAENSQTKTSGTFYSCPLTKDYKDCIQRSLDERTEGSLFGYVVDSQNSDNAIYTCAPRFLKSLTNVKYVEGACWELNEEYVEVDSISNSDCVKSINKNPQNYEFRNCLAGGALKSLGNKQLLLTAPYSYEGRGLLIYSIFHPESNSRISNYLTLETYMSKYQLTGLSMATGKIYREEKVKTVILGAPGMPQSNLINLKMGYGQVMLVSLMDNALSFKGLLYGDLFGSGFGYSVLVMDLNNDGYDELIVGAPFTGNNRGNVSVYWNQNKEEKNEAGYSFPLSLHKPKFLQSTNKYSNGQFGSCLENIGDINKDLYLDLAVGAPFEEDGRGSVYIFLGDKDGNLLLSQKIDASKIDLNFRGFGFSIYGKNEDLDDNQFPDVLVGAVVSGHVIGLRSRPLMKVYSESMLPSPSHYIPYNLNSLSKCIFQGITVGCIEIKISIFYFYPHLKDCPPNQPTKLVNFTVDLDRKFLSERVHFLDRSNIIKDSIYIDCKLPSVLPSTNSNTKKNNILFPSILFFNISLPIDIVLKWFMTDPTVPSRDYQAGDTLADLSKYPVMDRSNTEMLNQILFGAGCTAESCNPILTLQAELSLTKVDNEYHLYIGSSSSFTLKVNVKNIAESQDNRAYNTFIKIAYVSGGIIPTRINPGSYRSTSFGLIYAVASPLEVQALEESRFVFSLSNDFIEKAEKFIYLNVSLEAMSQQPHLRPIIMKIRIRMIANIDLKVSLAHIDTTSYQEAAILGISAITDEKKIGPHLRMKISLSNLEQTSVVVSSKLVIYFPWEVAGNPSQPHGQYLLYLLSIPKFFISGGKRNITCDAKSLKKIVNPIKTKMFELSKDTEQIQEVSLGNINLPKKFPTPQPLKKDLLLLSDSDVSALKSVWQNYVLLDCMNGSSRCVPIICDIGPLSRQSGEINIELDFRIWIHTFVENFIKYKFVQTEIPIFWLPEADYDIVLKNPSGSFKSIGIKSDNLQKPKAPPSMDILWGVVIAVCVGVFLLATIVIILYKCKFFRRQKFGATRKRRMVSKQT